MGIHKLLGKELILVPIGVFLVGFLLVSRDANANPPAQGQMLVEGRAQSTPVLHYQGRLLDPASGEPKPDGTYRMIFSLYNVATGGTALWSETKDIAISNGLFNTLLGDTTPLNPGIFNGQSLWLGITVGADPETTPRQRVAHVAYALHAEDADTVDGQHAADFAAAHHTHDAADITAGTLSTGRFSALDDLEAEGAIGLGNGQVAPGNHDHDERYYTKDDTDNRFVNDNAGEVDNADVADGALSAEKIEGRAWTSMNDGANSGLDADLLDGLQADAFAATAHTHDAADITSGMLSTDRFSAYDDLAAEGMIGMGEGQVAPGNHNHDDRYYTKSGSDSRYVNVTGDTMSGSLTVPRVAYTTPRTHYFIVGSEGFLPGSNVDYYNTYGTGGAYIVSGSGALVAPVHLPQGAVVTRFKVFFYDDSSSDMTVYLNRQSMLAGSYTIMAQVSSSGISGYGSRTDTTIAYATVDNTTSSYLVYA
ncbi:MAG TPA: hypothetical protein EYP04_08005, partial [Anaerolineae bacterium]|nr:hypothetical protein [Anaerolineae bacterium]